MITDATPENLNGSCEAVQRKAPKANDTRSEDAQEAPAAERDHELAAGAEIERGPAASPPGGGSAEIRSVGLGALALACSSE